MLNEEKIRLMTGIAMFEKKANKEIFPVTRYFKSDYIGSRLIRSFLTYSFTCLIGLGMWVLYQIEDILNTMDISVLLASVKHVALFYVVGLLVYLGITWAVYSKRYDTASKSMKIYQAKLRRLEKKYSSAGAERENREEHRS